MYRRKTLALGFTSLSLLLQLSAVAKAQTAPAAQPGATAPAAPAAPSAPPATPAEPTPAPTPDSAPAPAAAAAPTVVPSATAPAAAPAEPASAAADSAQTDSEAAAMEKQLAEQTGGDDFKLDLYGFADFTYGIQVKEFVFRAPFNSFAIGNLNLYMASKLGDSWQSLAEVRFTYMPHGTAQADATGQVTRTDTTVTDYNSAGRRVRWGGVIIERAYLEYLAHPLLNIRAGQFLTPYGIWNVDHGSPVIIGVIRPFIVGEALFPESQTGIEIYGTHHFDPVQVGYHLTLSNGRGPVDTYQDLNNNKAIGGRLFAHADTGAGAFTLGMSGYAGRYTDATQVFQPDADGNLGFAWPKTSDYKELSLAADLKWEYGGLLVQSEAVMNEIVYDELRPPVGFVPEGPPGYVPDSTRFGAYGLVGYRFAWGGIMPFMGLEYYNNPGNIGSLGKSAGLWGGLNVRPTARVVLKAQYTHAWFPETPAGLPDGLNVNAIDLQAAWSF